LHITSILASPLLDEISAIVSEAAAAILAVEPAHLAQQTKADLSPVTAADLRAEAVIVAGLSRLLPGLPVVSEEAPGLAQPPLDGSFVLVDPLDGTREFIAGRGEFTVNVAIITDGVPVLGVIGAPALGLLWRGVVGRGAERLRLAPGAGPDKARERTAIRTRARPARGLTAAVSRSHLDAATEALLARLPVAERVASGSAVKFCRLAEGAADLYPRLSPTCEWDIAAGQAILAAAGGAVLGPDGKALTYGRADAGFRVPAFVAWGDPAAAGRDARTG
jgi:3'(2'), 5'-bisphosphate nucleotidase